MNISPKEKKTLWMIVVVFALSCVYAWISTLPQRRYANHCEELHGLLLTASNRWDNGSKSMCLDPDHLPRLLPDRK